MFFSEKIVSIKPTDKVLEIGPGATPYHRSDIFLEKDYDSVEELIAQSGRVGLLKTSKEVIKYKGDIFPFDDNEFDYIVCSHVLEHVDNVELFLKEVQRVGKRGYLEFPTVYYDYIYNFPEHTQCLFFKDDIINWMPKEESGLNNFKSLHEFFFATIELGYHEYINSMKNYFFQGFEWEGSINTKRVHSIEELAYQTKDIVLNRHEPTKLNYNLVSLKQLLKHRLREILNKL